METTASPRPFGAAPLQLNGNDEGCDFGRVKMENCMGCSRLGKPSTRGVARWPKETKVVVVVVTTSLDACVPKEPPANVVPGWQGEGRYSMQPSAATTNRAAVG